MKQRVQANLVEAHAAGGETRLLSSPFHAPRAEPASSRAILWQLAAGFQPAAARHASDWHFDNLRVHPSIVLYGRGRFRKPCLV